MVFKRRKYLPEGVTAFLEAAQVRTEHGRVLAGGAQGQGVVIRHDMIARSQFGAETLYSVHVRFRFDDGTEAEISPGLLTRQDRHARGRRPGAGPLPLKGYVPPA